MRLSLTIWIIFQQKLDKSPGKIIKNVNQTMEVSLKLTNI